MKYPSSVHETSCCMFVFWQKIIYIDNNSFWLHPPPLLQFIWNEWFHFMESVFVQGFGLCEKFMISKCSSRFQLRRTRLQMHRITFSTSPLFPSVIWLMKILIKTFTLWCVACGSPFGFQASLWRNSYEVQLFIFWVTWLNLPKSTDRCSCWMKIKHLLFMLLVIRELTDDIDWCVLKSAAVAKY